MKIQKLREEAVTPTKAYEEAAGWDVCSLEDKILYPGERHLFKIGLAMQAPEGHYLRIAPRSGLALKKGIDVLAGVVDRDWTGEIGVILVNLAPVFKTNIWEHYLGVEASFLNREGKVEIKKGEKIAQIIPTKANTDPLEIVEVLPPTVRANKGFGSSGS